MTTVSRKIGRGLGERADGYETAIDRRFDERTSSPRLT
jgi:hypothetical protein